MRVVTSFMRMFVKEYRTLLAFKFLFDENVRLHTIKLQFDVLGAYVKCSFVTKFQAINGLLRKNLFARPSRICVSKDYTKQCLSYMVEIVNWFNSLPNSKRLPKECEKPQMFEQLKQKKNFVYFDFFIILEFSCFNTREKTARNPNLIFRMLSVTNNITALHTTAIKQQCWQRKTWLRLQHNLNITNVTRKRGQTRMKEHQHKYGYNGHETRNKRNQKESRYAYHKNGSKVLNGHDTFKALPCMWTSEE